MRTLHKRILAAPAAALIGLAVPLAGYAGPFLKPPGTAAGLTAMATFGVAAEEAAPRNCYLQAPKYILRRCEAAHATAEQVKIAKFEQPTEATEEATTKNCYGLPPKYILQRCV